MGFPELNATLNFLSAVLVTLGIFFIKRKNTTAHKACMITAFFTSVAFLASYLYYHYRAGSKHFAGTGSVRTLYFTILLSHTILAVVIVPMVVTTLRRAWRADYEAHVRIARWTWPVWMYVSVTGVVIYLMLYRMF